MTTAQTKPDPILEENTLLLSRAVAQWFVRKDNKFYDIQRPNSPLSRNDVERVILNRTREQFPKVAITSELMKNVFKRTITSMHGDADQSIPVWTGDISCHPGKIEPLVWLDGAVTINSWQLPEYRSLRANEADYGIATQLLETMFPREAEREMFLNWLAWCLQNERDKPTWGPLLYSRTKGTGKSTLCGLVSKLFGESNSVTQNNVDMITSRFNMTVLRSKLVNSEELQLRSGSKQANMLKSYLTETSTLSEMKGREAERVRQSCCFLFTTNNLPTWIEGDDRRFYVLEIDHDGHAAGSGAAEFSDLIGRVHDFMDDPNNIAKLYNALMTRSIPNDFSAKTLNITTQSTAIMRRLNAASEQTKITIVREELDRRELNAIPEKNLADFVAKALRSPVSQTRHILSELGWEKVKVKWGGSDYAMALWLRPGFHVDRGSIYGKDFEPQKIEDHLQRVTTDGLPEIELIA